jgi:hypothetical protein
MSVSPNRPMLSSGVMTMGKAASVVIFTSAKSMAAAMEKPTTALMSAWARMTLRIYRRDEPMARSVANSLRWSFVLE